MASSSELVLTHNFPLMGGIARVIAPCLFQLENSYYLLIPSCIQTATIYKRHCERM